MISGTAGLFFGVELFGIWITPIGWTGFILFADAVVLKRTSRSLITASIPEFFILCIFSIVFWLIFEVYNLFIKNWHYVGLIDNFYARNFGYAWSFATIWPGVFEMRDLLNAYGILQNRRFPRFPVSSFLLNSLIILGVIFLVLPFVRPSAYLFPFVWTGFIFVIEPINYKLRAQSLLRDLSEGNGTLLWQLMLAGFFCGVLWEFWNYWSTSQWIYTVPYPPNIKIFEMPLFGWLGFPPLALECFVMWEVVRQAMFRRTKRKQV